MKLEAGAGARLRAARILTDVLGGRSTLPEALIRHPGPASEESFVRELCWGTARHALRLDALIGRQLDRPLRERDRDVHALLLVGAYQLGWTDVPVHAAVSATVGATHGLRKPWARGLVNAVLRRIAAGDPTADDPTLPEPARLGHPAWLLAALRRDWPDDWQQIVQAGNARPPMTLRSRDDRDATLSALAEAGIAGQPGRLSPAAVQLERPQPVDALPGFARGALSVQDEAAQLAAPLLAPEPGERVLDACAAPGGKTLHLAELEPRAELVAVDSDPRRCRRIEENLTRGRARATVLAADAGEPASWWDGRPFHRILIDAPCTATGILRRQPDVRLLRKPEDVPRLAAIQRRLLDALWPLLAPGGVLLYCTCSVLAAENEAVVAAFLADHDDAGILPLPEAWGRPRGPGRQLLPTVTEHDGFYFARLRRERGDVR